MAPFKCPDCGIWWAGLEHRCQPASTSTGANFRWPLSASVFTPPICVCYLKGRTAPLVTVSCPLHDPVTS